MEDFFDEPLRTLLFDQQALAGDVQLFQTVLINQNTLNQGIF